MSQPQWITPAGSLGTIPEGQFYSIPIQVEPQATAVYFRLVAGNLPDGMQITSNGVIEGVPTPVSRVQGVPIEVSEDVTSKFAVRAYTTRTVSNQILIDRITDRTFTITVTDRNSPEFVTPPGNVGTYYDGTEVDLQIQYDGLDEDEDANITLLTGELPPGLVLDSFTGLITGVIQPVIGPPGTVAAGYDATGTQYDQYPFDFATRAASKNFQFTLKIGGSRTSTENPNSIRTFEIYVYAKDTMSADSETQQLINLSPPTYDNFPMSADNTFITADVTPTRTPILLTPEGDLGVVRADNFYAFKFDAVDFDGDPIEYSITTGAGVGYDETLFDQDGIGFDRGAFSLPPGLTVNPDTGWFSGYIPDQGVSEQTYRFAIRVLKRDNPTFISGFYFFTITITGDIDTEITWITDSDLGTILNGSISTLEVEAVNIGGRSLQYRLVEPGSKLPQGLTLQPSGHITGRTSFNTFALDGGTTTFDINARNRLATGETTFDSKYTFTVNAFAPESQQIDYQIGSIVVLNGGSGYDPNNPPVITISAPPETADSIQATTGVITFDGSSIENVALGNPGRGYLTVPTVTVTSAVGSGAVLGATIIERNVINSVSVFRTFTLVVDRYFNKPYQKLYIKCMPPQQDRDLIDQLIQNQDIIPENLVYRPDDPNFGVAQYVVYDHAYGLDPVSLETYVASLDLNHYWKNVTLGEIKVAQALDSNGDVLYDVVYSQVIDNLVNNQGESVGKSVPLPYPINAGDSTEIDTVYPNSLINMRDQVISQVGQISPPLTPALPLWMTSKQANGSVLGFTPAWTIAYLKPGQGNRVAYNIRTQFGDQLNKVDFKIDRYELDRSQTWQWNTTLQTWGDGYPVATSFDIYAQKEYTSYAVSLGVTGRLNTDPSIYTADGTSTVFAFNPDVSTGRVVVTVNNIIQSYYNSVSSPLGYQILYTYNRPKYNVTPWLSFQSYGDNATVTYNGLYYLSLQVVPANTPITDRVYWQEIQAPNRVVFPVAPAAGQTVAIYQIADQYTLDANGALSTPTVFDAGDTTFVYVANRWVNTDEFDRYLLFPKINIIDPVPSLPPAPPQPVNPVVTWRNNRRSPVAWANVSGVQLNWISSST